MISKRSILLSHPTGNANVRAIADGLVRAGLLHRFYTCISIEKDSFFSKLSNWGILKNFQKRSFNPNLREFIRTSPYRELFRIISMKLGLNHWIRHEKGPFCIDKVYYHLDVKVSKCIEEGKAIYAYEDGGLISFSKAKSEGKLCLYDLPIGYWRAMRELLEKERKNRPQWAGTITCFQDSGTKLKRKDEELSLADYIFVASSFTKETLKYYPGPLAPVHVIPYGFPPVNKKRRYLKTHNRKFKLLFVGSLSQRKGIANVLEAVNNLKDRVDLTIIGNKVFNGCYPLEEGLKHHKWIPALSHEDILREMSLHDLFVFPSLFEGFGLVITEAMSQGTPVITTDRTCGRDYIKNGENGWITPAGDTWALTSQIEEIINNPSCLSSVGKAAMATAEANSMEQYGDRIAKILEDKLHFEDGE